MTAVTPEFYGASRWSAYPFTGPYDTVTSAVIDAQISVPGSYQGQAVKMTRFINTESSPPGIELTCGGVIIFPLSTPVVQSSWGDYLIWTGITESVAITLVIVAGADPVVYNGSGYEFVTHCVSYSAFSTVEAIGSTGYEVAGPGQDAVLQAGSHVSFAVTGATTASPTVTITAQYNPSGPCVPTVLSRQRSIKSINGVSANSKGDIKLRGKSTFIVDNITSGVMLRNVGQPCCDCADYVEVFNLIKAAHADLLEIKESYEEALTAYSQLLNYTKFLLRSPIVGTIDSDSPDSPTAECT